MGSHVRANLKNLGFFLDVLLINIFQVQQEEVEEVDL